MFFVTFGTAFGGAVSYQFCLEAAIYRVMFEQEVLSVSFLSHYALHNTYNLI